MADGDPDASQMAVDERKRGLRIAQAHLHNWWQLLHMQQERACAGGVNDITANLDAYLFAFALRNVNRSVRYVSDHFLDHRLQHQLDHFETKVSGWKDIRDVIEHFDQYERGEGKLQKSGRLDVSPITGTHFTVGGFGNDAGAADKTLVIGGLRLHIASAFEHASALALAANTAIDEELR